MSGFMLVTGASGFIGRRCCEELAKRGQSVKGLVRQPNSGTPVGVEVVTGDLLDRPCLRDALRGAETVIHLAARVHQTRETAPDPLREYRRVNVEGTQMLLEEARRAGVR